MTCVIGVTKGLPIGSRRSSVALTEGRVLWHCTLTKVSTCGCMCQSVIPYALTARVLFLCAFRNAGVGVGSAVVCHSARRRYALQQRVEECHEVAQRTVLSDQGAISIAFTIAVLYICLCIALQVRWGLGLQNPSGSGMNVYTFLFSRIVLGVLSQLHSFIFIHFSRSISLSLFLSHHSCTILSAVLCIYICIDLCHARLWLIRSHICCLSCVDPCA